MTAEAEPANLNASRLSEADYDRLYEYRVAPSPDDLRKYRKSRSSIKRKGPSAHKDPTGNRAVGRVMYSTKSDGYR